MSKISFTTFLLGVLLLCGCGSNNSLPLIPPPVEGPKSTTLTILHHNDGNSLLLQAGAELENFGGIARFATLVAKQRQDFDNILLVSVGNNSLASAVYDASLENGIPYFDALGMDLIGFDASNIGNHEFDFGPEVFANFVTSFSRGMPFLSANLDFSAEQNLVALQQQQRLAAGTIVEKNGLKIGLVGVTTPRIAFVSTPRRVEVKPETALVVQEEIDDLRSRGAGIVLVLSKLDNLQDNEHLLSQLHGVDLLIAGTPFQLLANQDTLLVPGDEELVVGPYPTASPDRNGSSVPMVTSAGQYKYLGRVTLEVGPEGSVARIESGELLRVAGGTEADAVDQDPLLIQMVVNPVQAFLNQQEQIVVATSEVELRATEAELYTQETNAGNLMADALLARGQALAGQFGVAPPEVALFNAGALPANQNFPVGPFTALEVSQLAPFPSFLTVLDQVSAEQLKALLENGVSQVEQPNARFAQISGLTVVWDPNQPPRQVDQDGQLLHPGSRIREVTSSGGASIVTNGNVVPGAPSLSIATVSFLAGGGDQYPTQGLEFTNFGETYRDSLNRFLTNNLIGVIRTVDYPVEGQGRIQRL